MNFIDDKQSNGLEHCGRTIEAIGARLQAKAETQKAYEDSLPICPSCGNRIEKEPCQICARIKRDEALSADTQRRLDIIRLGGLKAYNNFTLEKFTNKAAIKSCADFPNCNLFLWGTTGTGKTHLATALIRGYEAARVVKPQHIYRSCRGLKDGADEQAAIDSYIDEPYLVIDDLGVDKRTDFSFSTLYEIIDGRDMDCQNGLIITSNLSLSDLAARMEDDRIVSRINGICKVIRLTGGDGRDKP